MNSNGEAIVPGRKASLTHLTQPLLPSDASSHSGSPKRSIHKPLLSLRKSSFSSDASALNQQRSPLVALNHKKHFTGRIDSMSNSFESLSLSSCSSSLSTSRSSLSTNESLSEASTKKRKRFRKYISSFRSDDDLWLNCHYPLDWIPIVTSAFPVELNVCKHSCSTVGSQMFIFGGCWSTEASATRNTSGSSTPTIINASVALNDQFVLDSAVVLPDANKRRCSNSLFSLDAATLTWKYRLTFGYHPNGYEAIPARMSHASASYKYFLIIFGGIDCSNSVLGDVQILNTRTMHWITRFVTINGTEGESDIPCRRFGHSAWVYRRKFHVFGGSTRTNSAETEDCNDVLLNDLYYLANLESLESEDPILVWRKVEPIGSIIPSPRSFHACTLVYKHVIVLGGRVDQSSLLDTDDDYENEIFILNMSTMEWKRYVVSNDVQLDTSPTKQETQSSIQETWLVSTTNRIGASISSVGPYLLVIGGTDESNEQCWDQTDVIDLRTMRRMQQSNKATRKPRMSNSECAAPSSCARAYQTVCLLDQRVVMVGGVVGGCVVGEAVALDLKFKGSLLLKWNQFGLFL